MKYSHNSGDTYVVPIFTTPTLIKGHDVEPRIDLSLYNDSSQTIYIGYKNDITTDDGFPLFSQEKENEAGYHGALYGIVASTTANIRVRVK